MSTIYAKRGVLYIGFKEESGRWIYKSTGLKDTKENRLKLNRYSYDKVYSPKLLVPNLGTCISLFLASKHFLEPDTLVGYELILNQVKGFVGDISVNDIGPEQIQQTQRIWSEKHSKNTLASYNKVLRMFFNFLVEQGYVEKNFIANIKYSPKAIRIIPDEVMDNILEKSKSNIKHYRLIYFLYQTGFRLSEALNLKWEDVQFENRIIIIRNAKDGTDNLFPLTDQLAAFLKEFRSNDGKVFGFNSKYGISWLRKKFFRDYSFHDIRRTFATRLLKNNVNPYKVMKLMRHKDFKTTMNHYAYIDTLSLGNELVIGNGSKGSKTDKKIPENTGKSGNKVKKVAKIVQK